MGIIKNLTFILDGGHKKYYTEKEQNISKLLCAPKLFRQERKVCMEFIYQANELKSATNARKNTFLLTNGLGGYASVTGVYSAPRCDQGILVAAEKAPNVRINLVHRISEKLYCGEDAYYLSSQAFADGTPYEDGYRWLRKFAIDYTPMWQYDVGDVLVERHLCIAYGENSAAVTYHIENNGYQPCTLVLRPYFKFAPKEEAVRQRKRLLYAGGVVVEGERRVKILTDGDLFETDPDTQWLAYAEDAKDGRPDKGMAFGCCEITMTVEAGETADYEVVFTAEKNTVSGWRMLREANARLEKIESESKFRDPVARQLELSADAYIARRDSTGGKTILAGYPLFSDWGRDTMIALPGCCLATGRYEEAKSILRTFLAYEKDGLVPNLFPEGDQAPMYNTVDAALILIDSVWKYVQVTQDWAFAWEAWEPMSRIIAYYRKGTHHGIGMDTDGLIFAGEGLDQVTWMDVCVQGILPTPRHGKPVEINAYWYNALMIMDRIAEKLGYEDNDYAELSQQVKESFCKKFYIPEKGYLKDVLSGTDADEQIRCNQIWALSMTYTMLTHEQERNVLDTVQKHLYTPYDLRILSPEDPQYHPYYGGEQLERDMAYHQGTTWVFPMGAYYRAYLKVNGNTAEAVEAVKVGLSNIKTMMRQGCAGQLPEIYDGENPHEGKGCFAQAWSVGEILRVYEAIENLKRE